MGTKKCSISRLAAARPGSLSRLALSLEETSGQTPQLTPFGQTPQLTPHTMTETALKKSEDLLAKLRALGLSTEEGCGLEGDDENAGTLELDYNDALVMQSPCASLCASSVCLQSPK